MATPRTEQAHQKRVKEIADEAASKIAAESPIEEEVVITVEELPAGDTTGRPSGQPEPFDAWLSGQREVADAWLSTAALGPKFVADGLSAWLDMTKSVVASGAGNPLSLAFDPRSAVEASFKLAEDLLAVQKESLLRLVAATPLATPV